MDLPEDSVRAIGTNAELMDVIDSYMKGDNANLCVDLGPVVPREWTKVLKTLSDTFDQGVIFDYMRGTNTGGGWI